MTRHDEVKPLEIVAGENLGRAARMVRALVFGDESPVHKADVIDGETRGLSEDELFGPVKQRVITPPYSPMGLVRLVEQSSELQQCIDAMVDNIEGFGFLLTPNIPLDPSKPDSELEKALKVDRARAQNFFRSAVMGESFTGLRRETRRDLESTGNAYWEIIRNRRGEITYFQMLPACQMRLGVQDKDFVRVDAVFLMVEGARCVPERRTLYKRFRRYVQGQTVLSTVDSGTAYYGPLLRWFKEYGDPRTIDNATGEEVPPEKIVNFDGRAPMPESRRASEVVHWRIPSTRSPYGIPRWIGNVVAVLGVRKAEEVNYTTMANNNIPSLVISVSNGRLTDKTVERIEEFVTTVIRGGDNYSRFLLLEGEGQYEGEDEGHIKIDIKPLTREQHTDALFVRYIESSKDSIRRSFRLPELFVGVGAQLNRATAEAARQLADEQVFAPERDETDHVINRFLVDMGIYYMSFRSKTPNVTDNQALVAMLSAAERTGGITPRIARQVAIDVFPGASEAPDIDPEKVDPDMPFSLQMAEAVKNLGMPTEVNQQIAPVQPSGQVHKILRDVLDYGTRLHDELDWIVRSSENKDSSA